jgi:hypothetical protein
MKGQFEVLEEWYIQTNKQVTLSYSFRFGSTNRTYDLSVLFSAVHAIVL